MFNNILLYGYVIMFVFFLLFICLFCGIYLGYKIYVSFFPKVNKYIVIGTVLLLSNMFIILRIINKTLNISFPFSITIIFDIILAFAIYLFIAFLVTDIIRFLCKLFKKEFISKFYQGLLCFIFTAVIISYGYWNSHNTIEKYYSLYLDKAIEKPFRIIALADIHIGSDMSASRLNKEVELINSLNPDIVLIAGDIIDHDIKDYTKEHKDAFRKLKSTYGVYVATGNHEFYSGDINDIVKEFIDSNFIVLRDEAVFIEPIGIYILGRDSLRHSYSNGSERKSIEELKPLIKDTSKPLVIIDHVPRTTKDGQDIGADIQISGHTHDGQFFPLNLIVSTMYPISKGMINIEGFHFFVTSGLGLWGPPVRIGTDSEILIIDINNKQEGINSNI